MTSLPWRTCGCHTECRERLLVPPSNADEEEDDGDQHDGARHGHDDVQPQVEVGAPRNTANFLGLSKRNERFKIDVMSHQYMKILNNKQNIMMTLI